MNKYKNKDGIELNYDGHENNLHTDLVKEVIKEAIALINEGCNKKDVIGFLTENFSIEED